MDRGQVDEGFAHMSWLGDLGAPRSRTTQVLVVLAVALPIFLLTFAYLQYARDGWFYLDDFGFIGRYHGDLHLEELVHPEGFGRFVSTNLYWNLTWRVFGTQGSLYFAFNFATIVATSVLFATIAATHYGRGAALVAGLSYFALPNVIETYSWLSNSQHLIAHFFCALFLLVYFDARRHTFGAATVTALEVVLVLALLSNQLASALVIVPVVDLAVNRAARQERTRWMALALVAVTVVLFYFRTAHANTGPYATDFTMHTMLESSRFYFGSSAVYWTWLAACFVGAAIAARRRDALHVTLWLGSVAFLAPFLFFRYQHYPQYAALGFSCFFLALWLLVYQALRAQAPRLVPAVVVVIVLAGCTWGLSRFSEVLAEPWGVHERSFVGQMRDIADRTEGKAVSYCFTSTKTTEFPFRPGAARIPEEWPGLGYGAAFTYFVDASNQYNPASSGEACDSVVRFDGPSLTREDP